MKRTVISLICALLLISAIMCPAFADEAHSPRLVDNAYLLTLEQRSELLQKLDEISERQNCDVVIVTVYGLDGKSAQAYADDYYDYHNYSGDGILLLVSMGTRKWHISTTGFGITAITDAGLDYISDKFVGYLSDGEYYTAFNKFADLSDKFLKKARTGEPYDYNNLPKDPPGLIWIAVALIAGIIIAFFVTGSMKNKLKTVRSKPNAADYLRQGSLNVTLANEMFLYRNVSRTLKPENNSSHGGGSSTHISSSGTSHGGGGGSF